MFAKCKECGDKRKVKQMVSDVEKNENSETLVYKCHNCI
jgi:DNA-directed RNA polymerase subunit RPC12/RpoP